MEGIHIEVFLKLSFKRAWVIVAECRTQSEAASHEEHAPSHIGHFPVTLTFIVRFRF